MGVVYTVKSFAELERHLNALLKKKQDRIVEEAASKAADFGVDIVKNAVPKAFQELEESVHKENIPKGSSVVADAPHAAPVEEGSRPHYAPLEPLLKWTRLHGMPDEAAIHLKMKIAEEGSQPTWYMKSSVDRIGERFLELIKEVMNKEENT